MFVSGVVLIVFAVGVTSTQYFNEGYVIPQPKIEVFSPKGFRVSIEDSPGVHLFAFHGNINRKLINLEAGTFSTDILHKQNGRWTFENRSARLKIGDTINYWLFVIKDGLGYRLDDGSFNVKGLIPTITTTTSARPIVHYYPSTAEPPLNLEDSPADTNADNFQPPSSAPSPSSSAASASQNSVPSHLGVCEKSILNVTQTLIALQAQIDTLIKTNQQLTSLLQNLPDAKRLTFHGSIPPDGDAEMIASFLLREKLDLNPTIVSATRNADRSITFEVVSVEEKLNILDVAKEKLQNSKIVLK